jgi:hypothetical protein
MTDPNPPPPDASPEPQAAPEPVAPPQEARATDAPQPVTAAVVPPVIPTVTPPGAASHRRRGAMPALCALGFVLLVGGLAWVWNQQQMLRQRVAEQASAAALDPARLAALQSDLATLRQRLQRLEQRPAAPAVDLGALDSRLSALEQRPAAPAVDLGALDARVSALEHRPAAPAVDLSALDSRVSALEHRPAAPAVDLSALETRLSALEQRPPAAAPEVSGAVASLGDRLATLEQRLAQSEQAETSVAARAGRIARLQAASAALEAGQPLGVLPDAPAALTRFATARPPTEAALRLSFPAAAKRAEAASLPSTQGESLVQRMWQRAQSLITVRQGNKVVIGAPAATVLASARERLEAGDLAGAVAALGQLDGPAAQAMADWREQAQALLDARTALTQMAHS